SPRIAPPENGLVGSTATIPIVLFCFLYSRAGASTSVLLPAPGDPVTPTTRAFPLKGNNDFRSSWAAGSRFSTALMARANALAFPLRMSSTQDCIIEFTFVVGNESVYQAKWADTTIHLHMKTGGRANKKPAT